MDGTMRTALWYGPEDVRIEQRPIPEVDDDSVLIKTADLRNGCKDVFPGASPYPGWRQLRS